MELERVLPIVIGAGVCLVAFTIFNGDVSKEDLVKSAQYIAVVDMEDMQCHKAKNGYASEATVTPVQDIKGTLPQRFRLYLGTT
jgi:hypothetical protein